MRRAITTSVITARFDFSLSRFAGSIFLWGMVMNRKYFTIFIIVAVFLTVGLALLLIPDNKQSRHGSDSARSLSDPSRDMGADPAAGIDPEQLIADYKEWAKYPPDSRPLLESHVDVIDFRKIPNTVQRMPTRDGDKLRESGFSCLLQPEKHTATEGENMRIFLSCTHTGRPERESIRIKEIKLEAVAGSRRFMPIPPTVSDAGDKGDESAGDRIYTLEFRPRQSDWADMHLTVNFLIESDTTSFTHSLATHFFSSPVAPARFTGNFSEKIDHGSLVVTAELDVVKAGNYTIEANLMGDSAPVAFARQDANLRSGKQTVDLLFYGKVFHDRDVPGSQTRMFS
jgi:hypothetical protein